jgi:hypothetical protein
VARPLRGWRKDISSPFDETFNVYAIKDVGIEETVGMIGSERCEIYLNRIWLDSAHILKSGGAEYSGSNPLAKYNLYSGPSNIVVKGAECFVGLDCRFIALAGDRIQAVPQESGVFWRWRI